MKPYKGQRVVTKILIDRFPHFVCTQSKFGTVVGVGGNILVEMDEKIKGCEEWDNKICCHDIIHFNSEFAAAES